MPAPIKAAKDVKFCPFCGSTNVAPTLRSDAVAECTSCETEFEIMKLT